MIVISGIRCILTANCIKVEDSFQLDYSEMRKFCLKLKMRTGNHRYTRTAQSWTAEMIAHKFLYNLGYLHDHTADTDLDEHETLYRRFIYYMLCGLRIVINAFGKEV